MKKIIFVIMFLFTVVYTCDYTVAAVSTPIQQETVKTLEQKVSPVAVVNNPDSYLNKTITFDADFVAFSSLGLDYKPAFRDSMKYIGVLIQRDDVKTNVIPLSEMKIFLSRDEAEKHIELDQGDKIRITGKVFSSALGDAWVDVTKFNVISQKNKSQN